MRDKIQNFEQLGCAWAHPALPVCMPMPGRPWVSEGAADGICAMYIHS